LPADNRIVAPQHPSRAASESEESANSSGAGRPFCAVPEEHKGRVSRAASEGVEPGNPSGAGRPFCAVPEEHKGRVSRAASEGVEPGNPSGAGRPFCAVPEAPYAAAYPASADPGNGARWLRSFSRLHERYWLHGLLFAATLFSTTLVGSSLQADFDRNLPF